jgi:ABC-2 type transport system ATP-binding protein
MAAITVADLAKTYRFHRKEEGLLGSLKSLFWREYLETHAVDRISFQIEPGEIVGFLGPNGAGKTTTLKMLCGLLYPSSGTVNVLGHQPARREAAFLRKIALVMGQKNMLWWDLPTMDTLLLHKEIYRLNETEFRRNLTRLAELLEVEDLLHVQVRKLSLGERMKMELLAALIHQPAILFLDEPTIGLDVVSQQRVRDFLRQLNREQGTTILLTSHYMADIEQLCPRVLLIDHGHLHFDGALTELLTKTAPIKLLSAVFAAPPPPTQIAALFGAWVQPSDDPLHVRLSVPREQVAEIAGQLLHLGNLADLSIEDVPLEQIFGSIFRGQVNAGGVA